MQNCADEKPADMSLGARLAGSTVECMRSELHKPITEAFSDATFAMHILLYFKKVDFNKIRDQLREKAKVGAMSLCFVFSTEPYWRAYEGRIGKMRVHNLDLVRRYPPVDWIRNALPFNLQDVCSMVLLHKNGNPPERTPCGTVEVRPYYEILFDWSASVKERIMTVPLQTPLNKRKREDGLTYQATDVSHNPNDRVIPPTSEGIAETARNGVMSKHAIDSAIHLLTESVPKKDKLAAA